MLRDFKRKIATTHRARWGRRPATASVILPRTRQLGFEPLEARLVLDVGPLVISEFMAVNDGTLVDEDGEFSDWIEIHNPSDTAVDLSGWHLTDDAADLTKWQFPGISLEARDYLVVFASNKDRRVVEGELHTNFKLRGGGEYLALVRPDGTTVAHEFAPGFPEQSADVSYGLAPATEALLAEGAELSYRVPTAAEAALGTSWTALDFDDAAWTGGAPPRPVLITEAGPSDLDFVELQNVTGAAVDTSGWVVAVNDAYDIDQPPDINARNTILWELPPSMAAGEVLYRTDVDDGTDHYWGENIFWRSGGKGWVMIVDDVGNVVDFVVWGYQVAEIASLEINLGGFAITVEEAWSGAAVQTGGTSESSFKRGGEMDHNSAADWSITVPQSMGQPNAGLRTPFPSGPVTGVGFSAAQGGFGGAIRTDVETEMHGLSASLWTRIPFDVQVGQASNLPNPEPGKMPNAKPGKMPGPRQPENSGLSSLQLGMKYNDGFVAYLNGREIARRNAPSSLRWDSAATASRSVEQSSIYEAIDVSDALDALEAGENVLAIHGLNVDAADGDFLILPNLIGASVFGRSRYFANPTPGEPNTAGFVVINEIYYHPQNGAEPAEFIELYNTTDAAIDLSGWRFTEGVGYTFPAGTSIPAGGYVVVAQDPATIQANYGVSALGPWSGRLSNLGETIELVDLAGNRVARVRYADEGDWGVRRRGPNDHGHTGWIWTAAHDGGGKSLELINPLLFNEPSSWNSGQNWAPSVPDGGTPAAANSVAAEDIPPMILDVSQAPVIARSTDPVTVTARLRDELASGLSGALYWRRDGAASFSSLAMRDDGQSGDGQAGDGVYGVVLPAQPDRSVVEFYLEASDGSGNRRTFPAATQPSGEQLTNLLYQVDDTFDPEVPWDPESQPIYRLIMTEAERAELVDIGNGGGGEQDSNAQMNGTFISVTGTATEVRYTVGIRNRGNGSRRNPPNNYRVNFVHDRPWRSVTRINVNARYPYLQTFGSAAFRMTATAAAADASPVQARVNGRDLAQSDRVMYGSYAHLEVTDGDFVDAHFPDDNDGNLYKVFGAGELDYRGTNPDSYRNHYFKKTHEDLDDWSDLIQLTYVLSNAPEETYFQELSRVVNVDQWVRYFALDTLLGNLEGGLATGRGDDFALYRGAIDPRFVLIPHDLDTIMGEGNTAADPNRSIFVYTGVVGLDRFLNFPEVTRRYYAALLELIDTFYNPETLDPLLDQLLGGFVPQTRIERMKQFVVSRTAGVLAQIPRQFTIRSDLPVVDGYPQTTAAGALLDGTADAAATSSILVGGIPAAWNPRAGEWTIGEATGEEEVLFPQGSRWSYLQDGSNQGAAWRDPAFVENPTWATGRGVLAHETGALPASINTQLTLGQTTYYFRKHFTFDGDLQDVILRLRTLIDDGVIVYLNGAEVLRLGMPGGNVDYRTFANRGVGNASFEGPFVIPTGALVAGDNLIAAEVHQRSSGSSDIVFDLELTALDPRSVAGVPLSPGINRIAVETFDGPDGTGELLERGFIDIWQNPQTSPQVIPGGTIAEDTVLEASQGPYRVTGDLVVGAGATLTILPGTTLFFDAEASLSIRGRLVAEGTPHEQIRLTRVPGGGNWNGLQLLDTMEDNRLSYGVVEYGVTDDGLIGLENSKLLLDHVTLDHTDRRRIRTVNSSLIVRNSTFTDIFNPGQPPSTAEFSEQIWGSGPSSGGPLIIENNVFGTVKGNNDAIDLDGGFQGDPPGEVPVIQILNNTFLGSGDDALDLEGDAHIEGNLFMHTRKDPYNTGSGDSNVITAGAGGQYVVVRNVFFDADHLAQVKDDALLTLVNNTAVDVSISALYFQHPAEPGSPGRGAYLDGNIFFDTPVILDQVQPTTQLAIHRSIVPAEYHGYGTGNIEEDPRLADPAAGDFALLPGSPALGTGPNGLDIGALVPPGASISGEPPALTTQTDVTLSIGGPGITHYKARIDQGSWTPEIPVEVPLQLSNLADGEYTFSVIGKNFAGVWQDEPDAAVSETFSVDTSLVRVRINEVLAINRPGFPDLVELVNDGTQAVDLAGMSLSDDPLDPQKFVFPDDAPAETTIAPGGYLVLYADDRTDDPGLHLGFALSREGEGLFLYKGSDEARITNSDLVDSVEFGIQIPDLSIGRVGHQQAWALTVPTFGAANLPARTGDHSMLKINEWLASGEVLFEDDFVELYNADPLPVALGGLFLTDNPAAEASCLRDSLEACPTNKIAPLSYIAGGGFAALLADSDPQNGPAQVDFRLAADQELLGLFARDEEDLFFAPIDQVLYYWQTTDFSQGRKPDGAETYAFFRLPTPNVSNSPTTGPLGEALLDGLRITEIMYHPPALVNAAGADAEFIELLNVGDTTLDLTGVRLRGGIEFTFPELMLPPNQYVVVVRDLEAFERQYGPGINVAGQYSGNLSNGGEELILKLASPLEAAVLRFKYRDTWYPSTDGGGFALEIRDPTARPATWNQAQSWQAGPLEGGTPGSNDGQPIRNLLINEVLTHPQEGIRDWGLALRDEAPHANPQTPIPKPQSPIPPSLDAIELINPTGSEINIGGWYLSDTDLSQGGGGENLLIKKFRIPDDTIVPAGGYAVFDERDFNPTPQNPGPNDFALDGAHGGDVWLVEADASGLPVRVADHVKFGAAADGEPFGRWPNGSGPLYPMTEPTLDRAEPQNGLNSGPRVGPVILSEVHYNPDPPTNDEDLEFVEIYNASAGELDLTEWRIRGGIDFDFPEGMVLPGHAALVIVPFELSEPDKLAAFNTAYEVDLAPGVEVVGGYRGGLSDVGEKVQLQRPDDPPPLEPEFIPRLLEDEVIYGHAEPWPSSADGGGDSLHRSAVDAWGNAPGSWNALTPTPGTTPFEVPQPDAQVVGRYIFYNDSVFDGPHLLRRGEAYTPDGKGAGAEDDSAIAPDKAALRPGETATFANYSSYASGINGIMIDIDRLLPGATLEADDFRFRAGNSNTPDAWADAPAPRSITVRPGEGAGGSARVTLIWDDNLIQQQWLQVSVLATRDTWLAEEDVFYFGNAIGETGSSSSDAKVNVFDMLGTRDNQRSFLNPAPIDFAFDFNRDARVNTYDMLIARDHQTHFLNALKLITVPLNLQGGNDKGVNDAGFLNWLHEFDEPGGQPRPKRTGLEKEAVDRALTMLK